jgi:triosephosphate isomerase
MRSYLVAGNWKMNTTSESGVALARDIAAAVPAPLAGVDVLICPPFPYLSSVVTAVLGSGVAVGAQNAWHAPPGAYTGEVAAEMLLDVGCRSVIIGHSERRHVLHESDDVINRKVRALRKAGLQVILCVGELLEERDANRTEEVLDRQMAGGLTAVSADAFGDMVIAYEPVWAIGTGRTASPAQAQAAHGHLRNWLRARYNSAVAETTRILYGGSVKPDNAPELLQEPDVDGALVGGASLKAESFLPIVRAAVAAGN